MHICLRLFCVGMLPCSDKDLMAGWSCLYGILPNARNSSLAKIGEKISGTLHKYLRNVTVCRWIILGLRTVSGNECRGNQNTFSSNAFSLRIVPVTNYKRYGLTRHAVEPTQFCEKEDDTCILDNEGRSTPCSYNILYLLLSTGLNFDVKTPFTWRKYCQCA
jgi:hypothetical protein